MKSMKRTTSSNRSTVSATNISIIDPVTENQSKAFGAWKNDKHLILSGSPGTGKTFMGVYFGLKTVLDRDSPQTQLVILRSIVPTRDIGFLPGDENEKKEVYKAPYKSITAELCGDSGAWLKLEQQKTVSFESTSFIRGLTIDNSVILVDEMQNLTFHELDSVITRVGVNCRIIFCGDYHQSDLTKDVDRSGLGKFMNIIDHMKDFTIINFGWADIIRSDFVRDYIMTKEMISNGKA